jgi:SAM-dependent methyltransferase
MTTHPEELARWENRYATSRGHLFGSAPNAFLARQKALLRSGWRTLVPADGDGRNGVWLAEQGLDVLSTDFSPAAQERARAWAAARGVAPRFELTDVIEWDWEPHAFDCVVVIFTQFMTPPERTRFFEGIAATLRPGGLLLMQGYRPEQIGYGTGGPKKVEQLYTRDLLETAFAGFSRLEIEEYDAELHEGAGHAGMSAVIDLVGWR